MLTSARRLCYMGLILRSDVYGRCTREDAEESSNGLLSGTDSVLVWWTSWHTSWLPEAKFCLEADSRISIQETPPPAFCVTPEVLYRRYVNLPLVTISVRRNWWKLRKPRAWWPVTRLNTTSVCQVPIGDVGSCLSDVKEVKWDPVVTSAYGRASSQAVRFWLECS